MHQVLLRMKGIVDADVRRRICVEDLPRILAAPIARFSPGRLEQTTQWYKYLRAFVDRHARLVSI